VPEGRDHRNEQVRPGKLTCFKQNQDLLQAGLNKRSHEQVDVIPERGDDTARAENPRRCFGASGQ
jgi:hypothetical protein